MKRTKQQFDELDELFETCENQEQLLGKLLTTIFNDQYIFTEKSIRKLLQENSQGYIHVEKLLQFSLIETFFQQAQITSKQQQIWMIQEVVESRCPQLCYQWGRIRRLNPFDFQRYKKIKPICLQRVSEKLTIADIRSYFNEQVFASNRAKIFNKDQDVLIYSLHYRENMAEILSKNPPFQILDYQGYYKQYDLAFRLRQRKHKALSKPLEPPRRIYQNHQTRYSRNRLDEQYQDFKLKQNDHRLEENNQHEQFVQIGRRPNPEFNNLLLDLFKDKIDSQD